MVNTWLPFLVLAPFVVRSINKAAFYWKGYRSIEQIWLLKNGDQILVKTYDGIMHKLCIQEITDYNLIDKQTHMEIIINNCGKMYEMSTKNKKFINFIILDKIIKGVCIETDRTKGKARTPANLRAKIFVEVRPSQLLNLKLNPV